MSTCQSSVIKRCGIYVVRFLLSHDIVAIEVHNLDESSEYHEYHAYLRSWLVSSDAKSSTCDWSHSWNHK